MRVSLCLLTLVAIAHSLIAQILLHRHRLQRRIPYREEIELTSQRTSIRDRVSSRIQRHREKTTSRICYDLVGCFEVPHSNSPLQKIPESPDVLNTKFYLFRRDVTFSEPEILVYDDNGTSLAKSKFNFKQNLKVYIHGYQSRWNEKGVFLLVDAFLKMEDTNVLIMDWTKGARGPQYAAAAANTEIAGRQLGLLLMSMFERGLEPLKTHLIGFSLGAHVAGCASEMTKSAGNLIGRITGLDPAGPLFRHNHLKEKTKKLDRSDAHFVDILHTDSSPVFIDGFGLWEPIGHADYYANGGQQQPGCQDLRASIVQTTFDRTLNKDNACSHLRAYYLYLESLMNKVSGRSCEFIAYKCPGGLPAFETGQCFPQIEDKTINPLALDIKYYTDIGKMGISSSGDGVMYFTTRNSAYFCGTQLQAHLALNEKTPNTKGIVNIQVVYANSTADFEIEADLEKPSNSFYALSAAEYSQTPPKSVTVHFNYRNYELRDQNNVTIPLGYYVILDKFELRNIHAQSWNYCQKAIQISRKTVSLKLHLDNTC